MGYYSNLTIINKTDKPYLKIKNMNLSKIIDLLHLQ